MKKERGNLMKTMKATVAILLMLLAAAAFGNALNTKQVPAAVTQRFARLYPQVTKLKWSRENGDYEANFTLNSQEMSVIFNARGKRLETETEIPVNQLPKTIQNNLHQNFMGYKVTEAARIESDRTTKYEAEIHKGMRSYDVIYAANGTLLQNPVAKKQG